MKKKRTIILLSIFMATLAVSSCNQNMTSKTVNNTKDTTTTNKTTSPSSTKVSQPTSTITSNPTSFPTSTPTTTPKDEALEYQGASGYISNDLDDFSKYQGTDAYVEVTTPTELFNALMDAKIEYTSEITEKLENNYVVRNNVRKNETNWTRALTKGLYLKNGDSFEKIPEDTPWDPNDTNYTSAMVYYEDSPYDEVKFSQTLTKESKVHVIEIKNDLNLGYNKLSSDDKSISIVNAFSSKNDSNYTMSSMYKENGMSQIAIERTNDLLIYSKNGSKITHGGFKINYCNNIAIRNLEMDEMWQWEDTSKSTISKVGDYDAYGWAYLKIGFSNNIWIDHMTFGKSFDGQIDVANQYFSTVGTYQYAPYGTDGRTGVHISWCKFTAGSDDEDGYISKMMKEIEEDYQNQGNNYLYYKKLRDSGISYEDIFYGIAIPQKKAFLDGDSGNEYKYNLNLNISIANCYFKNIEDRLPKVRGGNAYIYNTIIDNFEYITYRDKLKALNVQALVQQVNSSWKCALVSQGIVCGNGGSVMAENCIFRGIQYLLKDNDSSLTNNSNYPNATYDGGYRIVNSTYQYTSTSNIITDSKNMPNDTPAKLKEENFKWNTNDGNKPFDPVLLGLDVLENEILSSKYRAGSINNIGLDLLKARY